MQLDDDDSNRPSLPSANFSRDEVLETEVKSSRLESSSSQEKASLATEKSIFLPNIPHPAEDGLSKRVELPALSKRRVDSPSSCFLSSNAALAPKQPMPWSAPLAGGSAPFSRVLEHPPAYEIPSSSAVSQEDSTQVFEVGEGVSNSYGAPFPPRPYPPPAVVSSSSLPKREAIASSYRLPMKVAPNLSTENGNSSFRSTLLDEKKRNLNGLTGNSPSSTTGNTDNPSYTGSASTDSLSFAVVPFCATMPPDPRASSSPSPPPAMEESPSSPSSSSPRVAAYMGHIVQVCPTCHRPLDTSFAPPFPPQEEKKLTSHYFRQLSISGPPPLLAIMDVPQEDNQDVLRSASHGPLLMPGKNNNISSALPVRPASMPNVGNPPSSPAQRQQLAFIHRGADGTTRSSKLLLAAESTPMYETTSPSFSVKTLPKGHHSRTVSPSNRKLTGANAIQSESTNTPRRGHRTPPQATSLDMHPSMYSYVSPLFLQDGAASPTSANAAMREGHSPIPEEVETDRELLELLASHQAKLSRAEASNLVAVEDEHNGNAEGENEKRFASPPESKPNTYYEKYFIEAKKLGSGTFGGVYLCMHVMEGVPLGSFALKKIPVGDDISYLQNVLKEVRILEEVKRHPNVVEYNHSWVDEAKVADFGPTVRCLFILMEYANEGSLESYLERHNNVLSTIGVWYFFLSAVAGTAHLHQKNILHRDLKPQNLLLSTRSYNSLPRVLVSDFGTAALLGENTTTRTGGTGTLEYMAPELFERDLSAPLDQERYIHSHTKSSDVWSLGMILHYLACSTALPKKGRNGNVVLDVSSLSSIPRPPEMIELIRAMLQVDPKKRPSCKDIIRSTVAQTLLYSFNNVPFTAMDLFPLLYGSPSSLPLPLRVPLEFRQQDEEMDSDEEPLTPTEVVNSPLESSRVELLSTVISPTPFIQQYQSQEQRNVPHLAVPSTGAPIESPVPLFPESSNSSPSGTTSEWKKNAKLPSNLLQRRVYSAAKPSYSLLPCGPVPQHMNTNEKPLSLTSKKLSPFATLVQTKDASVQTDPVIILENEN